MTKILIENLRRIEKGNLRVFLDVRIRTPGGDWVIRNCRIVRQPGQRAWFSLPTVSWQDETGKACYKTMVELPNRIKSKISKAALEAYNAQAIAA